MNRMVLAALACSTSLMTSLRWLRRASTDHVRSHASSSASTHAHRRARQAVPVPAIEKITSCPSTAAVPMQSQICNGSSGVERVDTRRSARAGRLEPGPLRRHPTLVSLRRLRQTRREGLSRDRLRVCPG
jgi:hypothetical protein